MFFASSAFFSLGHLNFLSKRFLSRDTLVLFCLQLYTGLCFAGLYCATGELAVATMAEFWRREVADARGLLHGAPETAAWRPQATGL